MKTCPFNKKGTIYAAFCLLAAIAGAVWMFFLLKYNSDATVITAEHRSVLLKTGAATNAFIVFAALAAAAMLSGVFVLKKSPYIPLSGGVKTARFFLAAACAAAILFTLPLQFILNTKGTPYEFNSEAFSLQNGSSVQKISLVLAVFGSTYFLVRLFIEKTDRRTTILKTVSGMLLVFYLCSQLLVVHDYMSDFLHSPTRVMSITSYCFLVFFLLAQIRLDLPGRARPALHAVTGLLAFFFVTVETVPILILSLSGDAGYKTGIGVFYLLVKLFIGAYAFLSVLPSLLRQAQTAPEGPNEEPAAPDETGSGADETAESAEPTGEQSEAEESAPKEETGEPEN